MRKAHADDISRMFPAQRLSSLLCPGSLPDSPFPAALCWDAGGRSGVRPIRVFKCQGNCCCLARRPLLLQFLILSLEPSRSSSSRFVSEEPEAWLRPCRGAWGSCSWFASPCPESSFRRPAMFQLLDPKQVAKLLQHTN